MTISPAIHVVAVHGGAGGGFRWDRLRRPLAPDVVLHGLTLPGFQGRPLPDGPVTISTFTDAVAEELVACPRPRVLLGHGVGGAITLDLAAHHPELLDGLILHSPVGPDLHDRMMPKLMSFPVVQRLARRMISSRPVQVIGSRYVLRRAPQPYVERFLAEYGRAECFETMFELFTEQWFESLPPIPVPTSVLWGANDGVLDSGQMESLLDKLGTAEPRVESAWGHYPMIEQPGHYADVVSEVARGLVPGPAQADA